MKVTTCDQVSINHHVGLLKRLDIAGHTLGAQVYLGRTGNAANPLMAERDQMLRGQPAP